MKNLLIVDDQTGIRLLLDEVFKNEGYQTRLASNGREALLAVEESAPDCILLDMKMPGISGLEVLAKLSEIAPQVPVIIMTAYGESELLEEAFALGAIKYFTKPFDIYEVSQAVNDLFRNG